MQADQARSPANGRANGHSSLSLEKGRGRTSTCKPTWNHHTKVVEMRSYFDHPTP